MTEQKDIKTLQAEGKGPAPCARFCEATAFRIEIAGWKRDQAENLANQCKLVDQITSLTASRDAYAKAADDMAASHKVERDHWYAFQNTQVSLMNEITAERDEFQATITAMCNAIPDYDWGGDSAEKIAALAVERDALKADAERYRYLRSKQMQYSLPNNTVAMLVSDMTALDATMKEIK